MDKIRSITVVGGGSAGWITASFLAAQKKWAVTLIESDNIPIIGVGESTIPGINDFMQAVGLTEQDLFDQCGAVRKYGIQHNDWREPGNTWMHMFCQDESQLNEQFDWMHSYTCPTKSHRWAYHLDANRLATVLKDKCGKSLEIKHVIDDILDVAVDAHGVTELTGKLGKYTADLYVDCTGFRSLIRSRLGSNYHYHDSLINNCALAGPGEYVNGQEPLPYTQTFRMDYGWRWRISLQHRTGNGYVFNQNILSIEQAREEFIAKTPGLIADKIFQVPFENRYNPEPFKKNVVAIGLSCGFLEPLESTGLFLVHGMLNPLVKLVDDQRAPDKYNKIWNMIYKDISDFLSLFYRTSKVSHTDYWNTFNKVEKIAQPTYPQFLFSKYNYRMLSKGTGVPISA